jgi:hypothetical protein
VTVPDRQAIALRCDPEGIVERLLVDEIGASQHIGPGRSFVNAVDPSSKDEAHNFLSTIARELVAFDRGDGDGISYSPMPQPLAA